MSSNYLPWEEQDALNAICEHHGITEDAIKDLSSYTLWIKEREADKARLSRVPRAAFPVTFLGQLGVLWGRKKTA